MAAEIIRLSETTFSIAGRLVQIDSCEAYRLTEKTWNILNSGYVGRCYWDHGKVKNELLHRSLIDAPHGLVVDHIDGDKLNNRISNLRLCTPSQNLSNRPRYKDGCGFKGVQRTQSGTYKATITANRIVYRLGTFSTAEDAYAAYCEAAAQLHREFSRID